MHLRSRFHLFFLLLLVAIGGVWTLRLQSGVFRAQSTTTSTLTAVADSFVSSTESTTALGAFNYNLQVSNYRPYSTTFMREIFVKFNTSGVDTTFLASARLLLNLGEAASASNTILRVRMLTDSNDQWSEMAITYANRPTGVSSNPEVTFSCNATLCANPSNTNRPTLEIDVTSLLQQISNQNGTASFQIDVISTTQVSGLLGFSSKDSATGLPPRLEITLRVPTCGDGIVTAARGEQCDDGNNIDTDACPNSCLLPRCGDGILQINEQCDDGNNTNDDGCSSTCAEEPCYGSDDPCCGNPDICCHYPDDEFCPLCGDGNLLAGIEGCDDGNRMDGDGCRWNCTVETAASSAPPPSSSSSSSSKSSSVSSSSKSSSSSSSKSSSSSVSSASSVSSLAVCGNGIKQGAESCDDGNVLNGDGCSSGCQLETGWNCAGIPSICTTLCGDGFKTGTEQCDDGNLMNGDGCSSACQLQAISASSSSSSAAVYSSSAASAQPLCGNGRLETGEQCETNVSCPSGYSCAQCSCVFATIGSSSRRSSSSSARSVSSVAVQSSSMVSQVSAICGNNILETGEQCEITVLCAAGSVCVGGCQCSSLSTVAVASSSFPSNVSPSSVSSAASIPVAAQPVCGNGMLDPGEQCELGLPCPEGFFCAEECHCATLAEQPATEMCGNGIVEGEEQCDDGNLLPFDGCSFACRQETGHACFGEPSSCQPVCGDGVRIPPEQCDDGNLLDGDGCSSVCEIEFAAAEESSSEESSSSSEEPLPLPVCGNGILEEGEECDDANPFEGDGCSALCLLEQISSASSVSSDSSASSVVPMPAEEATGKGFPWLWLLGLLFVPPLLIVAWWMMRKREIMEA